MATGLRLVWSSPSRRAPGSPPQPGSPPPPGVVQARALVDAWVSAPFESGPGALDDLVLRIAAALEAGTTPVAIAATPGGASERADPS